jgi:hypothetical protein
VEDGEGVGQLFLSGFEITKDSNFKVSSSSSSSSSRGMNFGPCDHVFFFDDRLDLKANFAEVLSHHHHQVGRYIYICLKFGLWVCSGQSLKERLLLDLVKL